MVVAAVVVVALVLVLINVLEGATGSSSPVVTGADRSPAAAPAAAVQALTSIPSAVYDRIGTSGEPAPFAITAGQPPLRLSGKARLVYEGAEYCPYCAADRYAIIAALARFGRFSGLGVTASGDKDGNIPTFSFLNSTYQSRYVAFTPYEAADRLGQPLQRVPQQVQKLFATYAGDPATNTASRFGANRWAAPGIPFLDLANRYVVAGTSSALATVVESGVLNKDKTDIVAISKAIRAPATAAGRRIGAASFVADANYLAAGICSVDGGRPASVCASAGVRHAATVLARVPPIR
ncbi:MAG: DUF929 family protein [Actinomycetota bacterium]|nr:DUF929 family protein [Actinomycetota bacterium]